MAMWLQQVWAGVVPMPGLKLYQLLLIGVLGFFFRWVLRSLLDKQPVKQGCPVAAKAAEAAVRREAIDQKPILQRRASRTAGSQGGSSWFSAFACCTVRTSEVDEDPTFPISKSCCPTAAPKEFAPTLPSVVPVDPRLCAELRGRLVDLLGPVGLGNASRASAAVTVERYGGERSCFSRFLRARQLNVKLAEQMLRSTIDFRKDSGVNDILTAPCFQEVWKTERPFWPMSTPVFSRDGSVVVFFRMAHFIGVYNKSYSEERVRSIYLCMMERVLRLQHEGRRRRGQGPKDEMPPVFEIYDLTGMGLEHFRCFVGLRMLPRVLSIGQKHYPENLRTALMLNAPRGFEPIWNMVKKVLHENTQKKVHIRGDDGRDLLAEVLGTSEEEVNKILSSIVPYSRNRSCANASCFIGSDLMDWLEQSDLIDK